MKILTSGQKSWVTRRKNAVSLRQRKAAFKAWKTIRKNNK